MTTQPCRPAPENVKSQPNISTEIFVTSFGGVPSYTPAIMTMSAALAN